MTTEKKFADFLYPSHFLPKSDCLSLVYSSFGLSILPKQCAITVPYFKLHGKNERLATCWTLCSSHHYKVLDFFANSREARR